MKTSSFCALIFSLAINGFNTFDRPAVAEGLPHSWHVAEALAGESLSESKRDNLVVAQVGAKYGYKEADGKLKIEARFDNAYEFFEGLAAVRIDGKWGFIDDKGKQVIPTKFENQ
jgi:WG containing repeat